MAKKLKVAGVVADLPADYSGEVSITRSHSTHSVLISPIEDVFSHGDSNVLKDKINEILKLING
jgi:hypothetical protein